MRMSPGNRPSHGTPGTNIHSNPNAAIANPTSTNIQPGCAFMMHYESKAWIGVPGHTTSGLPCMSRKVSSGFTPSK